MKKPEHIDRMESELAELDNRINKLADFLKSDEGPVILNQMQRNLLYIQLDAMNSYRRVLTIRIEHELELVGQ